MWALIGLDLAVLVLTNEPLGFTLECCDYVPLFVLSKGSRNRAVEFIHMISCGQCML